MGIIESRRQILSLLTYFTNIGLDTVSNVQPTLATGVDGGESDFFGGDQTAHAVLILQQLNKTVKNTFLS